jgi:hypothetical protein
MDEPGRAVARAVFIHNHGRLMRQGAEGLARMLRAPLLSQENIDLKAGITLVDRRP